MEQYLKSYRKAISPPYSRKDLPAILLTLFFFATIPLFVFFLHRPTTFFSNAQSINEVEAETGVLLNGSTVGTDSNASGGQYVQLGTLTANNFQPTAPYFGTFFYPWFKNQTTDGSWSGSTWSDGDAKGAHSPPANWFSNYLPDLDPSEFNPQVELYSSNDYAAFKWQVNKLAEARQEVAISSWWAQNHKTDIAFRNTITDFMNRADNPYPNLRWALYYECEGNASSACGGTSNPSVAKIVSDLNYIADNYVNQPGMLKINAKPVIFVYGDSTDVLNSGSCTDPANTSYSARWAQAKAQAKIPFYIVLKVYSSYSTDVCQPDSWHQYAPATRSGNHGTYSYYVSPGFWRSGDAVRLCRNLNGPAQTNCDSSNPTASIISFGQAITSMVASSTTWRLTETWNEWGEGSAVEPGVPVIQANGSIIALQDPNGVTFGNAYIDVLKNLLPPLEQGTGSPLSTPIPTGPAALSPTPTITITPAPPLPTPTTVAGADPIIAAAGDIACGADSTSATCKEWYTSELLRQINPNAVLLLGDTQYEQGQLQYYLGNDPFCQSNPPRCFNPTWGRFKNIIYPSVGNHEYLTAGATGYFDYFNGLGNATGPAGERTKGYYAFNLGNWRLYAINSNCSKVSCSAGSTQEQWLRNDLAANPHTCTLMYFHHPRWGSQADHISTSVQPLYQAFYDAGGDVILTGHIHFYERFAPQDPNGILDTARGMRQIIVGTGGRNTYNPSTIAANSEVRSSGGTFGVLKATLHPTSYDWQFQPVSPSTFTDSGTTECH